MRKKGWPAAAAALVLNVVLIGWCVGIPCISAWTQYGMVLDECPDGDPRVVANVHTYGLERNRPGNVDIYVAASWVVDDDERARQDPLGDFDATLYLVDGEALTELECGHPWDDNRGQLSCSVRLDLELPDGDYLLRAAIDTPLEDVEVDVELPLYRPAHIHVLSDRPLYEPGDTLQFRALSLRKGSLEPLDTRPGTWTVTDPRGNVLLEERTDGGPWGISASSFPLADDALVGDWVVGFSSGDDVAETRVRVEPFTLPRFTVETHAEDPWNAPGEAPELSGTVLYNSGAPVAEASVKVSLSSGGSWPLPNAWLDLEELQTDRYGRFRLQLETIPSDLVEPTDVSVYVGVTDTDGDTTAGFTSLKLSPDPLLAEAVTELGDGLMSDFNNRVYLRVTTPDGRALSNTDLGVRNLWDPRDAGKVVSTDEDGVAALQLDPGQPVNVVVPAQPIRPALEALVEPFVLSALRPSHRANTAPSIAERRDAQRLVEELAPCSHLISSTSYDEVVLETRRGLVSRVLGFDGALASCAEDRLEGAVLGTEDGLYDLGLNLEPPKDVTRLEALLVTVGGSEPEGFGANLRDRARVASSCVVGETLEGDSSFMAIWFADEDGSVSLRWLDWENQPVPWTARRCIEGAYSGLRASEAEEASTGTLRFRATPPYEPVTTIPASTTMQGFEFEVSVEDIGATTWRSAPGSVPHFRLRPDKVLLEGGEELRVQMLRGPSFSGSVPDALTLFDSDGHIMQCPRTPKALKDDPYDDYYHRDCPKPEDDNAVVFAIPSGREGFMRTESNGAQAIVYVRPSATLDLEITTAATSYAPGSEATLDIQASQQAVVSLLGVDQSLGQLAPLPGPDGLSELAVGASSSQPAWQFMDALALTSGAVRGDNAAMAAVLRVDALTQEDREPPYRSASGETVFNPEEELQSAFWELLGDLSAAVREWEATSPEDELLTNERLAEIHAEVLAERDDRGVTTVDAWDRPLELWRLPDTLLSLCEPRVLVLDATRVPEDVDPWIPWVREEMER